MVEKKDDKKNENEMVGQFAYQILSERLTVLDRVVSQLAEIAHTHEPEKNKEEKTPPGSQMLRDKMTNVKRRLGL